jgi:hypothetical protein
MVLDARMKPWYPEELFADPETKKLVDTRWNSYFKEKIEMGDGDGLHSI